MSLTGWAMTIIGAMLAGLGLLVVGHRSERACRACAGLGLTRGARGRWAHFCRRCGGSGQRDRWATRVLVRATRGRVLPHAGSGSGAGPVHGQGYVFNGGTGRGRPRIAPDPDDTRMVALEQRRIPARQRRLDRREAQRADARGPAWLVAVVRVWLARSALRRALRAAEDHRDNLDANSAGYRRMAGTGRDQHRRAPRSTRGAAGADGVGPRKTRRPRPRARSSPGARRR